MKDHFMYGFENSHNNRGLSYADWMSLLFIGLKLTGHIDWHWVWVLAPFWSAVLLAVIIRRLNR